MHGYARRQQWKGSRGRACWSAGQIGESTHPGQRVSAKPSATGTADTVEELTEDAPTSQPLPVAITWIRRSWVKIPVSRTKASTRLGVNDDAQPGLCRTTGAVY